MLELDVSCILLTFCQISARYAPTPGEEKNDERQNCKNSSFKRNDTAKSPSRTLTDILNNRK